MNLIIYWLILIVVLPLVYLFWWKKKWRLILGVLILVFLFAGFFLPGEITYSFLNGKITKETQKRVKKIDELINDAANQEKDAKNQEKIDNAKKIIELDKEAREKIEEAKKSDNLDGIALWRGLQKYGKLAKQEWIKKWSQEKIFSAFLFCGKEFNDKLSTKSYQVSKGEIKSKISPKSIIDFSDDRNSTPKKIKEKILTIIKEEEEKYLTDDSTSVQDLLKISESFSIIWFKNIDQITNPELEKLLVKVFDPQTEENFWKYKKDNKEITPSLLNFVFVATTLDSDPKLSSELTDKLPPTKHFLKKYSLTIFLVTASLEVIIFILLIRLKKKSQSKVLE